ncbi:MAG: acyltransferase [Desulfotomaculaceae bacterium]|nr:acyltransferase [Desulfotomaculaceae bacterium]
MIRLIYKLIRFFLTGYYTFMAGRLLQSVGRDTVFEGMFDVPLCHRVAIGDECLFAPGVSFVVTDTGSITLGNRIYIGRNCVLSSEIGISIGDNTMLAEFVSVIDANHSFERNGVPIRDQDLNALPVNIGSDVWIGRGCAILRGTTIGDGAVIGSNSVVNRDIPAYAVACGAPARVIKYRA